VAPATASLPIDGDLDQVKFLDRSSSVRRNAFKLAGAATAKGCRTLRGLSGQHVGDFRLTVVMSKLISGDDMVTPCC
jgi:hypothetical protein